MASKRVDKKNFKEFAEKLKINANILKRNYAYTIDQTVNKGQVVLKCTVAGTTDKEVLNLSSVSVGDTLIDGTAEWEVISITGYGSGSGGGTSISEWATSTSYESGDVVIYGDSLYRCNTDHNSTIFSSDASNWDLIFADIKEWEDSIYYTVGVTAIYNNSLYKCITAHTSTSTFDPSKWQVIGNYITVPIKVGEVGWVSWQYTLMTNHLALDGGTVSNFQVTYPELYDFFDTNSLLTTVLATYTANKALCYYDSSTDTATMPDFLDKTVWGSSTIEEKEAGLPNIKGSFTIRGLTNTILVDYLTSAFNVTSGSNAHVNASSGTGNTNTRTVTFNASSSNSIYSDSVTTVQPPAIGLIPQIRYAKDTVEGSVSNIPDWETAIGYSVGDFVIYDNQIYRANTNHTSTTFSADIANWDMISGLQVWTASTTYKADSLVYHGGKLYKVTTDFTSTSTFDTTNLELVGGGLSEWEATTSYNDGDILVYDGQIYQAKIDFTSSSTFDKEKILDEYTLVGGETIIPWTTGTSIATNDIVSYSGNYYISLNNFTCGQDFSEYALDEYVPKPFTERQIEDIIRAFNPVMSGVSTGNNYSTTEKRIGTWIDGKPLYQKTYSVISPSVADTDATVILVDNTFNIKEINGYLYNDGNVCLNFNYNTNIYVLTWQSSDNNIKMRVGSNYISKDCYITIKYTKATD